MPDPQITVTAAPGATIVIAPTYDEAANVEEFLRRLRAVASDVDILVVDDSSPDGTAAIAQRVAAELGRIDVLVRPAKEGLGSAYRAGFAVAIERGYSMVVQIDSDLSHDPAVLPLLIAAVRDGAELAIGSRYVSGGSIPHWPWFRRALSRWGNRYAATVLGTSVRDATSGYRVFTADILRRIDYASTRSMGYGFQIETMYRISRHGGRIVELPITFTDRIRGYSKMTWRIFAEELAFVTWWGLRDRVLRRGADRKRQPER